MRGANPYVATPAGVVNALTCGQWVKVEGYAKPARFVKYNADGTAHLVHPTGKGRKARVNMAAFRLACGKPLAAVIATAKVVNSRVVDIAIDGTTNDITPVGPAEDREANLQAQADRLEPLTDAVLDLLSNFI